MSVRIVDKLPEAFTNQPIEFIPMDSHSWTELFPVSIEKCRALPNWDGLPLFASRENPNSFVRPMYFLLDKKTPLIMQKLESPSKLAIASIKWEEVNRPLKISIETNTGEDLFNLAMQPIFPINLLKLETLVHRYLQQVNQQ